MPTIRFPYYVVIGVTALVLVFDGTPAARAQLGSTGRAADASQGNVMHQAQGGLTNYRETTDAHGIVVRQYVDAKGDVYAVSWRGPAMPDVRLLLGAYFDPFRAGANASVGNTGLHAAHVEQGDLVVENRVRLREFSGRAWLASELPPGVSATDIQ